MRRLTVMSKEEARIPRFKDEAEEAAWWFNNPEYILQQFKRAATEGRLRHGTVAREMAARQAAKSTTIRLDPDDRARGYKIEL
jgi:hypothetical protein